MPELQLRKSSIMILYICVVILALVKGVYSVQEPVCSTTGPQCYNATGCATLANGDYQWCGSCSTRLNCNGGVGTLYNYTDALYPVWDDNKKNFQASSTTCTECYVECPPWYIVPPVGGECVRTGPTCVPGINFCSGFVSMKLLQHCGSCSEYVQCGGLFQPTLLQTCLGGSVWDDNAKSCAATSTTCKECFEPCTEQDFPTTVITTIPPSTLEPTTTKEITTQTTKTTASKDFSDSADKSPKPPSTDENDGNNSASSTVKPSTTTASASITKFTHNVICIISAGLLIIII